MPSRYVILGEVTRVYTAQGDVMLIDTADLDLVVDFTWYTNRKGSAAHAGRRYHEGGRTKSQSIHRRLMNPPPELQVDHINGDGLDNRRCNLRICSAQANQVNKRPEFGSRTGFTGVEARGRRFIARIRREGRLVRLGSFATAAEAGKVYRAAKGVPDEFYRSPVSRDGGGIE